MRLALPEPQCCRLRALAGLPQRRQGRVRPRTLYLGSVNLTPTSLDDNRELGLLLAQPQTAAEVGEIVAADAAGGAVPTP